MLKFIMDEQLFFINKTSHTISDINEMGYMDFMAYSNMYYNYYVKKKETK
jgi:hypothetical protein